MTQGYTKVTTPPRYRSLIDREHNRIASGQRYDMSARLRPRFLFRQHEFATLKIFPGLIQKHCRLHRELKIPVEVLVEAVIVTWPIL